MAMANPEASEVPSVRGSKRGRRGAARGSAKGVAQKTEESSAASRRPKRGQRNPEELESPANKRIAEVIQTDDVSSSSSPGSSRTNSPSRGLRPRRGRKKEVSNGISPEDSPAAKRRKTGEEEEEEESFKPMKVKSRWRRSSELDNQLDNDENAAPKEHRDEPTVPMEVKSPLREANRIESPAKVADINDLDETKAEIAERMKTFTFIRENIFLCERRFNKQSRGMECDCTLSKDELAKGERGCGDDCLNRLLMIECGKNCSLGKYCSNKRFQNVDNAPTEVFKTAWKGFGVRATDDIPEDTFIMEYVGDVLDERQFRKRAKRYAKDDVQHFYFMALSTDYFIDASTRGNISRFINHSCDPNAETQKWTVNGELRVGFFTKRPLRKGEEITFDYKYERYGQEAQKCYCGSDNCRGWLGGEPDEEPEEEEEVEGDYWSSTSEEELKPKEEKILKVKIKKKKVRKSPRKIKNFEADEYEDEVEKLKSTGIRTKSHTVDLCRLMVRTTDVQTRMTLIELLRTADTPCRRLFLDYQGLKILSTWMIGLGWMSVQNLELKLAIEDTLRLLNIPHKTMLVDSKVWQVITRWSIGLSTPDSELSSRCTTPTPCRVESPPTSLEATPVKTMEQKRSPDSEMESKVLAKDEIKDEITDEVCQNDVVMNSECKQPSVHIEDSIDLPPSAGDETKPTEDLVEKPEFVEPPMDLVEPPPMFSVQPLSDEIYPASDFVQPPMISESSGDLPTKVEERAEKIIEALSDQIVESHEENKTLETINEAPPSENAAPVEKAEKDKEMIQMIVEKALALLESWKNLKEVFKIPKKERIALRAEHEREADRAAAAITALPPRPVLPSINTPKPSNYERTRARPESPTTTKRDRRISRFDDRTGRLQIPTLSREERRGLFAEKASLEEEEQRKRLLQQQQHENKCYYLRLDPALTPMFPHHPECYFDALTGFWYPMPEPYPPIEVDWGFPGMAPLPAESFKEGDPELPDPSYIYPPGVVEVSFLFGEPIPPPLPGSEYPAPPAYGYYYDPASGQFVPPAVEEEPPEENGGEAPPTEVPFLNSDPQMEIPFLSTEADPPPPTDDLDESPSPPSTCSKYYSSDVGVTALAPSATSKRNEVIVKLPPNWRVARDAEGRTYFYNRQTGETRWEPPEDEELAEYEEDVQLTELETASTDSEDEKDAEEDAEDSDDEDDEESDKEEDEKPEMIDSDLSQAEKELLLRIPRKKSKEERQHERRQKRERDREKREYERKRRRERHGKHRRDGLVVEHLIPRRSEKEKNDLMSFKEMRERVANRDAIREKQEREERAEEAAAEAKPVVVKEQTTTAAADTSSEVAKKIKEKFLKDVSKVVVKVLDPFRRPGATKAQIQTTEDFKHLAKKLTQFVLTKELKHCSKIEDLKCNESVKKKAADFVRKYMTKFGDCYKRSPPQANPNGNT